MGFRLSRVQAQLITDLFHCPCFLNLLSTGIENWKIQTLPLARIKKIMKSEEFILQELEKEKQKQEGQTPDEKPNVKFMISAEAPLLMSKACELLIKEMSARAWQHTERNRRRTLQRQDVHAAVGESEVFDFLIDLVPRVTGARNTGTAAAMPPSIPEPTAMPQVPPTMPMAPVGAMQQPPAGDFSQAYADPLQGGQFNNYMGYSSIPAPIDLPIDPGASSLGVLGQQPGQMQQSQQQQQQQQQQQHTQQWTDSHV